MHSLTEIPGIAETSLELLEAAGFRDCESLAKAGVVPLSREMERANAILQIADVPPTEDDIARWIRAARALLGEADIDPSPMAIMPVNFEMLPEVLAMLENAPCAVPFPSRWLAETHIKVSDIAPGILLNRCDGDLEIRIEDRIPTHHGLPKALLNQYVQVSEKPQAAASRLNIDLSKLRTVDEVAAMPRNRRHRTAEQKLHPVEHSVADVMEMFEKPDAAVATASVRKSRTGIRGVLHSDPWSIRVGAVFTLIMLAVIFLAVISAPLLLLSDRNPVVFHWVRPWWIVFPFLLPLVALFWLIWAFPCSCRICRQKLFVPKKHRKNAKAHHLPVIGYIVPLICHLLVFQWFRCTHCGTPVRLRK